MRTTRDRVASSLWTISSQGFAVSLYADYDLARQVLDLEKDRYGAGAAR